MWLCFDVVKSTAVRFYGLVLARKHGKFCVKLAHCLLNRLLLKGKVYALSRCLVGNIKKER